ncbi:MAG: FkbM family methyltransferase [Kiritimatiellia bacterium]
MNSSLFSRLLRRLYRSWIRGQIRGLEPGTKTRGGVARLLGYGLSMEFPDRRIWLHQFNAIFCRDCYGVGRLPSEPFVIDGGANIGTFSLFVRWLRPRARVIAFEALPVNADFFERNVGGRGMDGVELVRAAIGLGKEFTTVGGLAADSVRTEWPDGVRVAVVPLCRWITQPVDLLKLDVEGDECEAIRSAGEALRMVTRVVVEYHEYPEKAGRLGEMIGLLEAGGFDRFRLYNACETPQNIAGLPHYWCLVEAARSSRQRNRARMP